MVLSSKHNVEIALPVDVVLASQLAWLRMIANGEDMTVKRKEINVC